VYVEENGFFQLLHQGGFFSGNTKQQRQQRTRAETSGSTTGGALLPGLADLGLLAADADAEDAMVAVVRLILIANHYLTAPVSSTCDSISFVLRVDHTRAVAAVGGEGR
jgi:hypothetical protein